MTSRERSDAAAAAWLTLPRGLARRWTGLGARRLLRLALAGLWLLDAGLQLQPFMFTKAFAGTLASAAAGNPSVVAWPILWSARLTAQEPVLANAAFAAVQLLIGLSIAWRPALRIGLAASMAWSAAVWWLGEGSGGLLTGQANPVAGAPGAVALYALLAALLWPRDDEMSCQFAAVPRAAAGPWRMVWLVIWAGLACLALRSASPQGLYDQVRALAAGEPGWIAALNHATAGVLAGRGVLFSGALAAVLLVIAAGVFLPTAAARAAIVAAVALSALIWVAGQDFGGIFAGSATDPNSGPLLALLAVAFWPSRARTGPGGSPAEMGIAHVQYVR